MISDGFPCGADFSDSGPRAGLGRGRGQRTVSDRGSWWAAGTEGGDGVLGRVPQGVVDDEDCGLRTSLEASLELRGLSRVADNAQQQYVRSRPAPSPESIKRAKELDLAGLGLHPLFSESLSWAGVGWRRWTPQNLLDLTPPSLPLARLSLPAGGAAAAQAGGQHQELPLPGCECGAWARLSARLPVWTGSPSRESSVRGSSCVSISRAKVLLALGPPLLCGSVFPRPPVQLGRRGLTEGRGLP